MAKEEWQRGSRAIHALLIDVSLIDAVKRSSCHFFLQFGVFFSTHMYMLYTETNDAISCHNNFFFSHWEFFFFIAHTAPLSVPGQRD